MAVAVALNANGFNWVGLARQNTPCRLMAGRFSSSDFFVKLHCHHNAVTQIRVPHYIVRLKLYMAMIFVFLVEFGGNSENILRHGEGALR